jgi:hypothetical protein
MRERESEREGGKRIGVVVALFLRDAPTFLPKALRTKNGERPEFVAT